MSHFYNLLALAAKLDTWWVKDEKKQVDASVSDFYCVVMGCSLQNWLGYFDGGFVTHDDFFCFCVDVVSDEAESAVWDDFFYEDFVDVEREILEVVLSLKKNSVYFLWLAKILLQGIIPISCEKFLCSEAFK